MKKTIEQSQNNPATIKSYAPIALFTYNRPLHTLQTIKALQANTLASMSDLVVYSDAAKTVQDERQVAEVRSLLNSITGFKSVQIIEQKENQGLARSIIEGVTQIIKQHGKIIVVEDDLISSPDFLQFMNDSLDFYSNTKKVMHVSGYMFPIDKSDFKETFFYRSTSCWGWATWERAWTYFEKNPAKLIESFSKEDISRFNIEDGHNFWSQVLANYNREIDTWAIFWYASVFQNNGLCLHPRESFIRNIGHDGSGIHCSDTELFNVELAEHTVSFFETAIIEPDTLIARMKDYYSSNKLSKLAKVKRLLKKIRVF